MILINYIFRVQVSTRLKFVQCYSNKPLPIFNAITLIFSVYNLEFLKNTSLNINFDP